jgi:hypothetical protein
MIDGYLYQGEAGNFNFLYMLLLQLQRVDINRLFQDGVCRA